MAQNKSSLGALSAGLDKIQESWAWFVALGTFFIALGAACIANDVAATTVSMLTLGWLLLLGAAAALVQSCRTRDWSGFFLYFLTALLRGLAAYLLIRHTDSGQVGMTVVLAALLVVGGTYRLFGASALRFPKRGWAATSGILSVALGVMLLDQLPASSLWFLGIAIGVDFVFDGSALIALGMAVHQVPAGRGLARA